MRQQDRTANGAAVVIRHDVRFILRIRAVGDRVEPAVLEIPKGRSMKAICTGLGDCSYFSGLTVLGVIVHAIYTNFGD